MNNQNKTFVVLPGGETCKQLITEQIGPETHKAIINSPIYPLTEVMPEGEMFEGSEVHSVRIIDDRWEPISKSEVDYYEQHGYETRIVIKPLKAIDPVKEEVESWKPDNIGSNPNECIFPTCTKENCRCFTSPQPLPSPNVVENKETVEARFYSEQEVKLIATRFARQSRMMHDVTSNDTITSYENWFKPENFKHTDSTQHNHASFVALVEGRLSEINIEIEKTDPHNYDRHNELCSVYDELTDLLTKIKL